MRDQDYPRRATLDVAICSSGTATLENALLGVPMVVVYKLSWPTYAIARTLVTVPHIAMANLLAGKSVVPELIQHHATPARVAAEAAAILDDPSRAAPCARPFSPCGARSGSRAPPSAPPPPCCAGSLLGGWASGAAF